MSAEATRLAGPALVHDLTRDDLIPELEPVVAEGWVVVEGAVLLKGWYESYFGDRSAFAETLDYEVAVNGRGIPSFGLTEEGVARVPSLLRTGTAFARAALHQQYRELPEYEVTAFVTAAPTLFDPEHYTGNMTFCVQRPGGPRYLDPDKVGDYVVVSLSTAECHEPLPAGPAGGHGR